VYYTLISSKFMEIFVSLNVALVTVCAVRGGGGEGEGILLF
jgi:hypothetical protein